MRNGYYVLGPGIVEMDLQIRRADPLLLASNGVLKDLVDRTGHAALLLAAFDDNSVLCVGEHHALHSPVPGFGRGQRRPLFEGAGSR